MSFAGLFSPLLSWMRWPFQADKGAMSAPEGTWEWARAQQSTADRFLTTNCYKSAEEILQRTIASYTKQRAPEEGEQEQSWNELLSCLECSRGVALSKLNDSDAALSSFSRSLETWPSNAQAWNARAMHYLESNHHLALATRDINQCIRLNPRSATALANRAAIRLAMRQFDLAEKDCRLACTLEPDSAAPRAHLAVCMSYTDRPQLALKAMAEAIAADTTNPQLYVLRAGLLSTEGRLQDALGDLDEALRLVDNSDEFRSTIHIARAQLYMRQEQWQSAISSLTRALPIARAILSRAECYRNLRQWSSAMEDYTSLINTDEKSSSSSSSSSGCVSDAERAEALAQRAHVRMHLPRIRFKLVETDASQALELKAADESTRFAAYSALALVALFEEKHRLARYRFTAALQLEPEDFSTLANRAVCNMELGDDDKAMADLDEALRIDANNAECLCIRARTLLRLGRVHDALKDANRALSAEPDNAQALIARAEIRLHNEDYGDAVGDCVLALDLEPGHAFVQRIRDKALAKLIHQDDDADQPTPRTKRRRSGRLKSQTKTQQLSTASTKKRRLSRTPSSTSNIVQ